MRRNGAAKLNSRNSDAPPAPADQKLEQPVAAGVPLDNAPFVNGKDRSATQSAAGAAKEGAGSFWDFTAGLGDRWASGEVKTYIYRVWPRVDKQQEHVYLTIVQQPVDEEYLLRNFGSGRYLLIVKDRGKMIRKHTASVHNRSYPPRVEASEVVDDPVNDSYFKAWTDNKPSAAERQGSKGEPVQGETAQILQQVFERGAKVDPQLVDLWKHASAERDALAKLLSEKQNVNMPVAAPAPGPDVLGILTQVKALQADPLAMLEKMQGFFANKQSDRPRQEPPPTNSLDDLKRLLEVFGQAKELFKSDTPAPAAAVPVAPPDADAWESIAMQLPSQVAPIVSAVSGLIYAIKSNAGAAPQTGPVAAPAPARAPVAFNPYDANAMREYVRAQRAAAQPSAPGPSPAAGAASPTAPGAPQPQPAAAQGPTPPGGDGMQQLAALMTTALSCLNRGVDGREASESIISLNGDLAYASICDQIKSAGVPVVLELAKTIPEIGGQVIAYEARLKVFIAEFLEGPQWNDEEETKPNLKQAAATS